MFACLFGRRMTSIESCLCLLCYQKSPSSTGSLDALTDQTNKRLSKVFWGIQNSCFFPLSHGHTNKQKCSFRNAYQGNLAYFEKTNPVSVACCYFLIIVNHLSMHKNMQMGDKWTEIWCLLCCYAVEVIFPGMVWFPTEQKVIAKQINKHFSD